MPQKENLLRPRNIRDPYESEVRCCNMVINEQHANTHNNELSRVLVRTIAMGLEDSCKYLCGDAVPGDVVCSDATSITLEYDDGEP